MATPWCEFCATEMLIFMVVWASAGVPSVQARLSGEGEAGQYVFMGSLRRIGMSVLREDASFLAYL